MIKYIINLVYYKLKMLKDYERDQGYDGFEDNQSLFVRLGYQVVHLVRYPSGKTMINARFYFCNI
jgi:hypothetical protein